MTRTITDVDEFTDASVPEAGDTRGTAAEAVDAIGQALANRTRNLKNRADVAAYLAAANVFTNAPQYMNAPDCEIAQREILRSSRDEPTNSSNAWKLIDLFATDLTARKVRIYSGGNDATGTLMITVNAFWHKSDQKWRQDVVKDAFALFVKGEQMFLARQASGVGAWTSWPTNLGDLVIGGEVLYAGPVRRETLVNINNATGAVLRNNDGSIGLTSTSGLGTRIAIPVWLPPNAVIIAVKVNISVHDAAQPPVLKFVARPTTDFTTPSATLLFNRDTQNAPAATGVQVVTLDPSSGGGGYSVDPTTEEYAVQYELGSPGTSATAPLDAIQAIQVIWDDYGGSRCG